MLENKQIMSKKTDDLVAKLILGIGIVPGRKQIRVSLSCASGRLGQTVCKLLVFKRMKIRISGSFFCMNGIICRQNSSVLDIESFRVNGRFL